MIPFICGALWHLQWWLQRRGFIRLAAPIGRLGVELSDPGQRAMSGVFPCGARGARVKLLKLVRCWCGVLIPLWIKNQGGCSACRKEYEGR